MCCVCVCAWFVCLVCVFGLCVWFVCVRQFSFKYDAEIPLVYHLFPSWCYMLPRGSVWITVRRCVCVVMKIVSVASLVSLAMSDSRIAHTFRGGLVHGGQLFNVRIWGCGPPSRIISDQPRCDLQLPALLAWLTRGPSART